MNLKQKVDQNRTKLELVNTVETIFYRSLFIQSKSVDYMSFENNVANTCKI